MIVTMHSASPHHQRPHHRLQGLCIAGLLAVYVWRLSASPALAKCSLSGAPGQLNFCTQPVTELLLLHGSHMSAIARLRECSLHSSHQGQQAAR